MLKKCVKNMEDAKDDKGEAVKYSLKDLIPWNWLVRVIKRHDYYALVELFPLAMVARFFLYPSMMQSQIDMTNKAIEYLEEKKKELKKL